MTISFDAATQGYTLSSATGAITFLPAHIDAAQSSAASTVYVRTLGAITDTLTLTKPGTSGPLTYTYVGSAFWQRSTVTGQDTGSGSMNAVAYGVPTPASAVPRTGAATFAIDLLGARTVGTSVVPMTGNGNTLVDFGNGLVSISGKFTGVGHDSLSLFVGSARLSSADGSFVGSFILNDFGVMRGSVNGRLYGPGAEELGAAVRAESDSNIFVGTIMGRRSGATIGNTQFNSTSGGVPSLTDGQVFTAGAVSIDTTLTGISGENTSSGMFSNASRRTESVVIHYDATSQRYAVFASDDMQAFLPGALTVGSFGFANSFSHSMQGSVQTTGPIIPLTYTRMGRWTRQDPLGGSTRYRLMDIIYGFPTGSGAVPRNGTGNFRLALNGTIADAGYLNLMNFTGTGVLEANFATGLIVGLGSVDYGENYTRGLRTPAHATGNFNLSAQLASSANQFDGTINLIGIGAYGGALRGQFFGPAAEEIGATFSLGDGAGGVGTGAFVGVREAGAGAGIASTTTTLGGITISDPLAVSGGTTSGSVTNGVLTMVDPLAVSGGTTIVGSLTVTPP